MNTANQKKFYASLAKHLTKARERKKLTVTQLATLSGEQFNTIQAIERGEGRFMFHQAIWMKEVLGLNINMLLQDCYNENDIPYKGDTGGDEIEKESNKKSSGKTQSNNEGIVRERSQSTEGSGEIQGSGKASIPSRWI